MDSSDGKLPNQPTPDYGSLGPGSDMPAAGPNTPQSGNWRILFAIAVGALLAVPFGTGRVRAAWQEVARVLSLQGKPEPASPAILSEHERAAMGRKRPQQQAQLFLERAVNHYDGANDQIATRVDGWRGRLQLTPQLNSLITTALNSNDLRVRAAGIEVDLAATGIAKTSESADRLMQQATSGPQSQRVWGLWTLGLLGNRGVERERVSQFLIDQLRDSNPAIRQWTVEGLSYLGTDDTIEPLLRTFHDDPSPVVRERAACGLAQSGMLSQEQRLTIVPKLLDYAEDSSLDTQTHNWVYHALRDITAQNLPENPAAWRNWYNTRQN